MSSFQSKPDADIFRVQAREAFRMTDCHDSTGAWQHTQAMTSQAGRPQCPGNLHTAKRIEI